MELQLQFWIRRSFYRKNTRNGNVFGRNWRLQRMSNSSGKFRFFDLKPGNNVISIYDQNFLVYRTKINIAETTPEWLITSTTTVCLLGTYNL